MQIETYKTKNKSLLGRFLFFASAEHLDFSLVIDLGEEKIDTTNILNLILLHLPTYISYEEH